MDPILKNFNFSIKPSTVYGSRGKHKGSAESNEYNFKHDAEFHTIERLNAQQRELFDWVLDNPNGIALLQAGPGESIYHKCCT